MPIDPSRPASALVITDPELFSTPRTPDDCQQRIDQLTKLFKQANTRTPHILVALPTLATTDVLPGAATLFGNRSRARKDHPNIELRWEILVEILEDSQPEPGYTAAAATFPGTSEGQAVVTLFTRDFFTVRGPRTGWETFLNLELHLKFDPSLHYSRYTPPWRAFENNPVFESYAGSREAMGRDYTQIIVVPDAADESTWVTYPIGELADDEAAEAPAHH